MIEKLRVYC